MSSMKSVGLNSFAGGEVPYRFPAEFSERQWQELHGFVIEEGGKRLRSQWDAQYLTTPPGVSILRVADFATGSGHYLMAVCSDGGVYYAQLPSDEQMPAPMGVEDGN